MASVRWDGLDFQDTSEKLLAYAYIWGNQDDPDLYGEWDFEVRMFPFFKKKKNFHMP
jgi:hypothetical protein